MSALGRGQIGVEEAAGAGEDGERRGEVEAAEVELLPDGEEGAFRQVGDGEEAGEVHVGEGG